MRLRHTRTRTTRTTRTPTRARTHTHTHALSLSLSLFLRQAAAHPNIHKANVTQKLAQRHTDLVHGKVVSNAVAVAHRERDPRIRVNTLVQEPDSRAHTHTRTHTHARTHARTTHSKSEDDADMQASSFLLLFLASHHNYNITHTPLHHTHLDGRYARGFSHTMGLRCSMKMLIEPVGKIQRCVCSSGVSTCDSGEGHKTHVPAATAAHGERGDRHVTPAGMVSPHASLSGCRSWRCTEITGGYNRIAWKGAC